MSKPKRKKAAPRQAAYDRSRTFHQTLNGIIRSDQVVGELPPDDMQDAWRLNGSVIEVDLEVAKDVVRRRIAREVAPRLATLRDIIEERQDNGLGIVVFVARRKTLRAFLTDARVTNATTLAELEAAQQAILGEIPLAA